MRIVPGDPASVSSLGSELSRRSAQLEQLHTDLTRARSELDDWHGPSAEAFSASMGTQLRVAQDVAAALAGCAQALQDYAVELQQARAAAAEAEDWCDRNRLTVDDALVVSMPWGPYGVTEAQVHREKVPQGQRLVDVAREQAEDAALRLQRGTSDHVAALGAAGYAATAAVQSATYQVQLARS